MPNDAGAAVPPPPRAGGPAESPLRVEQLRIQDLRVLKDFCIDLSETTVLVGENNVGKTAVLRGLELALGSGRGEDDDFRVDDAGNRVAEFVVDVRIVPATGAQFTDEAAGRLGGVALLE
jgi:predicted ATP-dependent endonuclease of OLD family